MSRFYSTEKEAPKETEGENAEAEDPVKQELEQKNREVIELKVCIPFPSNLQFHCRVRKTNRH
jgi:molecular chaperone GrpE